MSQVKILLAEDDKRLGTILKAYMDAKGYATTLCVDGEEAIEAFNAELFDLCITDVVMPGMDGFTLAKQIKALKPYMPLIFLTAKKSNQTFWRVLGWVLTTISPNLSVWMSW